MNRRGTDKILSVYWFSILFIVAVSVVYMAIIFYGKPYDVRNIEVNLLINKVVDCMVDNGKYAGGDLGSCPINFNVEGFKDWSSEEGKEEYYAEVEICDLGLGGATGCVAQSPKGNVGVKEICEDLGSGGNNPVCIERSVYALQGSNKKVIKIYAGVRKTEKNVQ